MDRYDFTIDPNSFDYPEFTRDMVKTHTILIPNMLSIHMDLFEKTLISLGYKTEILRNEGPEVVATGLKYVHNDICYPAMLVIGQFIDALNHRDDLDKVVLLISQTGGGCRASNYMFLLRKAIIKAGYGYIPVISFDFSNLSKKAGVRVTPRFVLDILATLTYSDELMYLKNKVQSYEVNKGDTQKLVNHWINKISNLYDKKKGVNYHALKNNLKQMCKDFDNIEVDMKPKIKVGIVGEIYIKYAPLGNNHLEDFLLSQDCEVALPGLYGFVLYCLYNNIYDYKIYKKNKKMAIISKFIIWYIKRREKLMIDAFKNTKFKPMNYFYYTKDLSNDILDHGTKMGEGWLLTAEMRELIEEGYTNVICAQPFGCLPNHICGKGVMKKIKEMHPESNIVAIDYDPSATKVNQENRIKLMLAIAKEKMPH